MKGVSKGQIGTKGDEVKLPFTLLIDQDYLVILFAEIHMVLNIYVQSCIILVFKNMHQVIKKSLKKELDIF